jgi:hypothetical protein
MLTAAREALVEIGALAPAAPLPPFWARMSGNLALMVYLDQARFLVVKIGIRTSLDREFRGLSAGHAAMPRHVPRPLGFATRGRHEVLVTEGVSHEPLVPGREHEWHAMFERDLTVFLAAGARHFRASPSDHAVNVQEALREAGDAIGWAGWRGYWDRVDPLITRLPRIPQHGDLAMNNIAIAGGGLVFFDWEDFGLVDLPGFDLAVALLSLHNFSVAGLRASLAAATMESRVVRQGCAHVAMAPEQFAELLPAYLSLFVKLKGSGGYDTEVPARAAGALREWIHASSAAAPA